MASVLSQGQGRPAKGGRGVATAGGCVGHYYAPFPCHDGIDLMAGAEGSVFGYEAWTRKT